MKINQLKKIIKDSVKEAIQEEMKEILIEAVKAPRASTPPVTNYNPKQETQTKPLAQEDKMKLRENMMGVLQGMMPGADGTINANSSNVPMKVNGPMDTTSANGKLPEGNVSMDQIMGLMNSKG